MSALQQEIETRFKCMKCNSIGATCSQFAATGTGISKILDIQYKKFITASCNHCGYTELYNPAILEKQSNTGTVLDVLFG